MVSEYPSMKTHPVTLNEIPYGMLRDYLLASSTVYPSMEPKEIAGKRYVDGGYSDNFPVNLALDMGAEDIIGVNLCASGIEAKYETDYPVRVIRPRFDLGPTMEFVPEIAKRNIELGYNDTMRSFGKFDGNCYTFVKGEGEKMQTEFEKFCVDMLTKCGAVAISEKDQYHRSLAVKGLCEKRKHRIGLMNSDLAKAKETLSVLSVGCGAMLDFIGIDMFIDICDKFGGSQLYFPKKESVLRASRNREIKRMCSEYSKSEIAKKFGITKRQVENILKN